MYTTNSGPRIVFAALVAGPTFVLATVLASWIIGGAGTIDVASAGTALIILPILAIATMFGAILALIPCAVGACAMGWLGRDNIGMRLPAMWGLAGAGLAGFPAFSFGGDGPVSLALAITGAICALACRHRVQWENDAALSDRPGPAICAA